MIIELFGCPGSGKTYALEAISDKNGYKNTSKTSKLRTYTNLILKKILIFSPCAILIRKRIFSQIDESKYTSSFNPASIKECVYNISMLAGVYRYANKNLYIDEGLIHRIIALCINYKIPKENAKAIIDAINVNLKNVNPYFLDTPIDICYESIKLRNRHEASIDSVSGEDLKLILRDYHEYCSYIADEFGYKRINREKIKEELL